MSKEGQGAERTRTKSYAEFLSEELSDPELAAAYLTTALEEGSTEEFLLALRSVADAHGGIGAVAEAAQLNRQTLYRTLSARGNPKIGTLVSLLGVMGLRLAIIPRAGAAG